MNTLSKERQEEINRRAAFIWAEMESGCNCQYCDCIGVLTRLLGFFKEAIQAVDCSRDGDCIFCGNVISGHKPECPWLMAQDD